MWLVRSRPSGAAGTGGLFACRTRLRSCSGQATGTDRCQASAPAAPCPVAGGWPVSGRRRALLSIRESTTVRNRSARLQQRDYARQRRADMRPWSLCARPTAVKSRCRGLGLDPCLAPTRQRSDLAPADGIFLPAGLFVASGARPSLAVVPVLPRHSASAPTSKCGLSGSVRQRTPWSC